MDVDRIGALARGIVGSSLVVGLAGFVAGCGGDGGTMAPVQSPAESAVPGRAREHVVGRDDTLYSIAWRHGLDYRLLAGSNAIQDPYTIHPGQRLLIPEPGEGVAPESGAARESDVAPEPDVAPDEAAAPDEVSTHGAGTVPAPVATELPALSPPPSTVPAPVATELPALSPPPSTVPAPVATELPAASPPPSTVPAPDAATGMAAAAAPPVPGPEPMPAVEPVSKPTPIAPLAVRKAGGITWRRPTEGRTIKGFGRGGNKGIDIAGAFEQPIHAAAPGQVVYAGSGLIGYGKLVIVKHDSRLLSAYAHNERLHVGEGDRVEGGQHIADMGRADQGRTMLHFEIRRDGRPVDPRRFLP